MIHPPIKKGFLWFTESHLMIACCASAFTASAFLQLSLPPDRALIAFIGFATLLMYNIQTLTGRWMVSDRRSFPPARFHIIPAVIGAAGLLVCLFLTGEWVLSWFIPPAVLAFLYAVPVFPYHGIRIALRGFPYLKIYLILFVWLWVTAAIPWFHSGAAFTAGFLLFCIQQGLFLFSLIVPFDVRDLKTDYIFQKTIPQMLGVRNSLYLAAGTTLLYGITAWARFSDGLIDPGMFLALILSGVYLFFCILYTRESRSDLFFTLLLDSSLWLQFIFILIFSRSAH